MNFLKVITLISFALFFIACGQQDVPKTPLKLSGAGQAMEMWSMARSYPGKTIQNQKWALAAEEMALQAQLRGGLSQNWEALGPKNIGGRMIALAFHPDEPETIFAGSASGGLWKTTTAGKGIEAWTRIPTGFPVLGVPAIAIDPNDPNVMYIGTGEVYNSASAMPGIVSRYTRGSYGIGILKSVDGGQTWTKSLDWAYEDLRGVLDLKINPQNTSTIFAATTEGVLRSTDDGSTWENVNPVLMATEIEVNPEDTNFVFVAHGSLFDQVSGIFRSIDGGNSFSQLGLGAPRDYTGKAHIALAPSRADVIYISAADYNVGGNSSNYGLYRSENDGASWEHVNDLNVARWQGWYSHDVAVSPMLANTVFQVGIEGFKSTNGGRELIAKARSGGGYGGRVPIGGPEGNDTYVHADIHRVYYHPEDHNLLFLACDGGVFASEDGGETFAGRNGGLQTTQFYSDFSNSATDPNFSIGGMQDNFTAIYDGQDAWIRVLGGDGMCTAIDPTDDNIVYGSSQGLNISRSTNRGQGWRNISPDGFFDENRNFNGPFELAPSSPNIIYAGAQSLWRSDDRGNNWSRTSGNFVDRGNNVLTIGVSPHDPDFLFIGTAPTSQDDANVMRTTNGGETFFPMQGLPDRLAMDFGFDPADEEVAYAVFSGFGSDHVFKTEDGGINWATIDNDLPDVPTSTVVVDPLIPSNIYVGNDLGVYASTNGGADWELISGELPDATMVMHLSISPSDRKLRVATHGEGVYQADLLELVDVEEVPQAIAMLETHFPNPVQDEVTFRFHFENAATATMQLFDSQGKMVKTIFEKQSFSGEQQLTGDLSDLPAGAYFYRMEGSLQANKKPFRETKTLIKQ